MRPISHYLDEHLVSFLTTNERDAAIRELVRLLDKAGRLIDGEEFLEAVLAREEIVSTGIGMGVAIPHAKLEGYDDFFIAIGVQKKGIAWDAIDGAPVRLIFLVGGPDDKQTEYLQILSRLTVILKDKERRKALLLAESKAVVIDLLTGSTPER